MLGLPNSVDKINLRYLVVILLAKECSKFREHRGKWRFSGVNFKSQHNTNFHKAQTLSQKPWSLGHFDCDQK